MTFQEICINRILTLSPRNQQRMFDNWNLYAALQLYQLLITGSPEEQDAARSHSANEVYETVADYLVISSVEAAMEEPAMAGYFLDHDLFAKFVYMAKHGLSIKEGDLPQ